MVRGMIKLAFISPIGESQFGDLDRIAQAEREAYTNSFGDALSHAIRCGEALIEIKKILKHGEYEKYLVQVFKIPPSTAGLFVRVARKRSMIEAEANRQGISDLSLTAAAKLVSRG